MRIIRLSKTATVAAIALWIGAARLLLASGDAAAFNRAKGFAVAGLTRGFLVWQVGFMSIGGEWFGMWMWEKWNGVPDAFRFFVTILMVLIYLVMTDRADDP
jgi:predicted small integral membrane protein